MRFIRFVQDGRQGLAVASVNSAYKGLFEGDAGYRPLDSIIAEGSAGLEAAARVLDRGHVVRLDAVDYLPPLAAPGKIICVGLNYRDHAAEAAMKVPDYPTLFARFPSSLVGHGAALVRPPESDKFDYEGELVAVIGARGRRIEKARALDHVAGYSIFNDGSIRDFQLRTPQWTMGKNFDSTGPFGPVFVTADELPPGAAGLRIETRLNGQVVQSASTADLIFAVASLVSMISVGITLEPGDIIVTGTPSGVGAVRTPPLFMKAGDVCEVEIEKIGTLRNPVEDDTRATRVKVP
jgi:acylpyruvate hydrolase